MDNDENLVPGPSNTRYQVPKRDQQQITGANEVPGLSRDTTHDNIYYVN
jgi:hypothetical protein